MGKRKLSFVASIAIVFLISSLLFTKYHHYITSVTITIPAFALPHTIAPPTLAGPIILNDPHLKVETVFKGPEAPTSMAFVGPNDVLVLEKDKGTVQRIIDGKIVPEPLLSVPVATKVDRGMLGIAITKHEDGPTYVFLYYT